MSLTVPRSTLGAVGILTAAFQASIDQLTDNTRQLPGGSVIQALTIAAGIATPTDGQSLLLKIDGEASAADDLDTIALTNIPDGSVIMVVSTDNARDITIRNSGNLNTVDSSDFILATTFMWWMGVVDGAAINELARSYGNEKAAQRTFLGLGTAAVVNTGTAGANVPLNSDILGKATLSIPADTMRPQTTNGCAAVAQVELTAQQPERVSVDFDGSGGEEHAIFSVKLPKSWDLGVIQARFFYTVAAAVTTTVNWGLAAVARADGEAIATAYGTKIAVTDAFGGTANLMAITSFTADITVGGTPADGEYTYFRVSRDSGSDTTVTDAMLIAIEITFTEDKLNDD